MTSAYLLEDSILSEKYIDRHSDHCKTLDLDPVVHTDADKSLSFCNTITKRPFEDLNNLGYFWHSAFRGADVADYLDPIHQPLGLQSRNSTACPFQAHKYSI